MESVNAVELQTREESGSSSVLENGLAKETTGTLDAPTEDARTLPSVEQATSAEPTTIETAIVAEERLGVTETVNVPTTLPLSQTSTQSLEPSVATTPIPRPVSFHESTSVETQTLKTSSTSTIVISTKLPADSNKSGDKPIVPPTAQVEQQKKRQKLSSGPSATMVPDEPKIYYLAEEEGGRVKFLVVCNDNSERSLIWLVNLKEIFAKQLPKMPREYIVRLLFDRSHHSLLCLENDQVVGGISFKPYFEQRFGEIAFCAVSSTHQVKGYGTRLMNHLKEYVKRINLTHFLTYADNFATGYFKKQGFSASISMPKERWFGYIKDYDGGTLMECVVHPQIDYFRIGELIAKQKAFLLAKIEDVKSPDPVYPGLSLTKIDDPYSQIPGLREAGWVKPILSATSAGGGPAMASVASIARALVSGVIAGPELQLVLRSVVEQVAHHKDSWPFLEPVPPSVVDYLEVIKEPIDLSLIRQRLESGEYKKAGHLRRDLQLMLDNCRTYNRPETTFYKAALGLQKLVNDIFGEIPPSSG